MTCSRKWRDKLMYFPSIRVLLLAARVLLLLLLWLLSVLKRRSEPVHMGTEGR